MTTTSRALSNSEIIRAAAIVLVGFLASGVLGLLRTAIFSAQFGASSELGAFYTAQQIPELLFNLVAGGALGSSFIPVYSRFLSKDKDEDAWNLASSVMTLSALAALVLGIFLILLAPYYMPILYSRNLYQTIAIQLTQIMMVTTVIFAISGLLMGILNAHQSFLLPALALSMNNIGLIFGALVIAPMLSTTTGLFAYPPISPLYVFDQFPNALELISVVVPPSVNVFGLAIGAVLGALLHLAIQLPGLRTIKARLRFLPNPRISGVMEVLRLMLPRVFGLAVTRINFLVNFFFANMMILGSETAFNTAWFLMFFALGIIAQSVGTAVFPSLSALIAEDDIEGFKNRLSRAMRSILFLSVPATFGLILMGEVIIAILFERGAWTHIDTKATAWALSFLAIGIAGHGLLEVLSRAFYAMSDTITPVVIGVISLVTNIILSLVFIQIIGDPNSLERGAFAGLGLSNSVTTILEAGALWFLLRRRIGGIEDRYVFLGIFKTTVATLVMSVVIMLLLSQMQDLPLIMIAIMGGGLGIAVFFTTSYILGLEEARLIPNTILRRIKK